MMELSAGKIMHVSHDRKSVISCECIGEPYSSRIVGEQNAEIIRLREALSDVKDSLLGQNARDPIETIDTVLSHATSRGERNGPIKIT